MTYKNSMKVFFILALLFSSSAWAQNEEELQKIIAVQQAQILDLTNLVKRLSQELTDAKGDIAKNGEAVSKVKAELGTVESTVNNVKSEVSTVSEKVENFDGRINQNFGKANANLILIQNLQQRVGNLEQ